VGAPYGGTDTCSDSGTDVTCFSFAESVGNLFLVDCTVEAYAEIWIPSTSTLITDSDEVVCP
ncbi:MAG: hypothetical protein AAGD38_24875, partial [Acidobacteriota bacterium]